MKLTLSALTALFASATTAFAADAPAAGAARQSTLGAFLPLIIFIGIFYLFILRPQKKRQKKHDTLVNSLQRGDKIITAGGFFGIVRDVKDDSVIIEIAEGLMARVLKGSISTKISPEAPKPAAKAEKTEKTETPKAEDAAPAAPADEEKK
ncbi:MAG: preprotein translocase subunit YajC [Pyramidobacter sp.]